jgi:hypothetical protein
LDSTAGEWVSSRSARYGEEALNAPVPLMEDDMTTPRTRALVSFAATLTVTLAAGACARTPSRPALDGPAPVEVRWLTIRFDNDARDYVHVYLIGQRREWLLGRVEPGAMATLRIPTAALAEDPGYLKLAVLTGEPVSLQAARDLRATATMAQPASEILSQQWRFSQGQLSPLGLWPPRGDARRR